MDSHRRQTPAGRHTAGGELCGHIHGALTGAALTGAGGVLHQRLASTQSRLSPVLQVAEAELSGVPSALRLAVQQLTALARELGLQQHSAGLDTIDPEEYVAAAVRPSMTEVRSAYTLPTLCLH
jgi:hypothetical protein